MSSIRTNYFEVRFFLDEISRDELLSRLDALALPCAVSPLHSSDDVEGFKDHCHVIFKVHPARSLNSFRTWWNEQPLHQFSNNFALFVNELSSKENYLIHRFSPDKQQFLLPDGSFDYSSITCLHGYMLSIPNDFDAVHPKFLILNLIKQNEFSTIYELVDRYVGEGNSKALDFILKNYRFLQIYIEDCRFDRFQENINSALDSRDIGFPSSYPDRLDL